MFRSGWQERIKYLVRDNTCIRAELLNGLSSNFCLAVTHVTLPKEKLPVEIACLDGVHVNL